MHTRKSPPRVLTVGSHSRGRRPTGTRATGYTSVDYSAHENRRHSTGVEVPRKFRVGRPLLTPPRRAYCVAVRVRLVGRG